MSHLRVYVGYDPRQPLAYNVLQHSIVRQSSKPVSITPLILGQLPLKRRGLTEFTFSRFLVPYLSNYTGSSLFLDADMVVKGDIAELFDCVDQNADVQVMQEQPQFEWASAMLFNNWRCKKLTPEFVEDASNKMFDLAWAEKVGKFPKEWNHCVGYMEESEAKLYHYTQGIPCWEETKGVEDQPWITEFKRMLYTVSWSALMGNSVHAVHVRKRLAA